MTAYQHLSQTPKHTIQASTQVKLLSWGSALCLKSACFLHLQPAACAELHSVDNIIKKKELWVQAWELPSFCPLPKMHKPLRLSKWGQYLRYSTSASLIPQNGIFCILTLYLSTILSYNQLQRCVLFICEELQFQNHQQDHPVDFLPHRKNFTPFWDS